MNKIKKFIYYGFAFVHHKDTMGGYHNIKNFITYDITIDLQTEKYFFDVTLKKYLLFKVFRKIYFLIFKKIGFLSIIRCSFLAVFKRNHVFHFIYPENTYRWIHKIKNSTNKVIFTFHQPASYFENSKKWSNIIKNIDAIIILNRSDFNFFKSLTKKNNVFLIPHGINTNFFTIDKKIKKENRILMVGNWLRNFELARNIFIKLNNKFPDIIIDLVINSENEIYFKDLNVQFYKNISNLDLKLLYQKSKIVFFPIVDFTANNAMLEAMACGTNILVATDKCFSDTDEIYKFITLVPNNDSIVYDKIIELLIRPENNDLFYFEMNQYCKNNYSWDIVAEKTTKLMNTL